MTKQTKKPADKIAKAGAVELEEQDLEDVQGGIGVGELQPAGQNAITDGTSRTAGGPVRFEGTPKTALGDGSV